MNDILKHPVFRIISDVVTAEGVEAYAIGGYVRDALMGRPSNDIDIVVVGSGIAVAEKVAARIKGRPRVAVFRNFGTAMLHYGHDEIEFVGARRESYDRRSRNPIVEDGTFDDDQRRRDFTVNTLAVSLSKNDYGRLVDTFGGLEDLRNGILRTPLEPDTTFSDDPLRMLRAVRFAAQLNFTIADETFQALIRNRERIEIVSVERITEELNKMLSTRQPSVAFNLMEKAGLLQLILPEISRLKGVEVRQNKAHKDVFKHTLQVLDGVAQHSDNLWLRWAALLHDVAKPSTKRFIPDVGWSFHGHEFIGSKMIPGIFKRMHLPLAEPMKYVQKLVLLHLRPIALAEEVTDSAVRRLLFEAGDDIDDLMTLCNADITSRNEEKVRHFMENYELVKQKLKEIEEKDAIRNFQPPVSGDEIMTTFGIGPSHAIGVIKTAIKDAILDGVIPNEHEAARQLMLEEGAKLGLSPVAAPQQGA